PKLTATTCTLALLAALAAAPANAQVVTGSPGTPIPFSVKPPRVFDPGPRPVGNQRIVVKGAVLNQGLVDTIQPKDARGNGAGRQLPHLTVDQTVFWFASLAVFGQSATVDGAVDPKTNNPTILGLGPAFNGDSCLTCHSFPAIGGTAPFTNPQ